MEAFSFGSYYPGDSAVHRLDPRTKLLLGFGKESMPIPGKLPLLSTFLNSNPR